MFPKLLISGLILALFLAKSAQAQVQIDLSKITCDQLVHQKVGPSRLIAAWFSGFYNGKQDNLIVDIQKFQANLNKVEHFCENGKNSSVTVLKAVEQVIETSK